MQFKFNKNFIVKASKDKQTASHPPIKTKTLKNRSADTCDFIYNFLNLEKLFQNYLKIVYCMKMFGKLGFRFCEG